MWALIRFQTRGAAGLAQRNALATFVVLILGLSLIPDGPNVLRDLGFALVARDAPRTPALLVALLALSVATHAVPVLRLGLGGWLRSLPLSDRDHRRALAIGLLVPLVPIAVGMALAIPVTGIGFARPLSIPALLGLPLVLLAAGAAALPVGRGLLARPLALVALGLATRGRWLALGGAALALLGWDLVAGAVALGPRAIERRHSSDRWLGPVLVWRALGWRLLAPTLAAVPLLGAALAYRMNNELTAREAGFGTRLALLATLACGIAMLGDALVARRRPWPWARSLPWSAARRVLDDALVLGVAALPPILLANLLDWRVALVGLAALPLLLLIALGALPGARGRLLGVSGMLSWRSGLVVGGLAFAPWLALAAAGLAPLAFRIAARAERRAVVTGWEPLHHAAAGDSELGSAR
ncbi:MAG: hypothetical protein AB7R55_14920 [Gemmatimonadales bacterium]